MIVTEQTQKNKDYIDAFNTLADGYIAAVQDEAAKFTTLQNIKDDLHIMEMITEQGAIDDAGNPKNLGSTEKDRSRAFDLAKGKSAPVREAKIMMNAARADHKIAQGNMRELDLRMQFMIALAKGRE